MRLRTLLALTTASAGPPAPAASAAVVPDGRPTPGVVRGATWVCRNDLTGGSGTGAVTF